MSDTAAQMKRCVHCNITKPLSDFHKNRIRKDGHAIQCKECRREYQRNFRRVVIAHYSNGTNCCACCGEDTYEFLSVDHIMGGGAKHRKKVGSNMAKWLVRSGLPEGYRILCHNCNIALGFFGYCPHQKFSSDKA